MRPIRDTRFGGPLQAMKDPELEITVSPRIFVQLPKSVRVTL